MIAHFDVFNEETFFGKGLDCFRTNWTLDLRPGGRGALLASISEVELSEWVGGEGGW